MANKNSFTYYQPDRYYDDGTNVEYLGTPDGLWSFQAFRSEEECELWLEAHGYNPDDFIIREYHDDDIEDVVIIDEYGDVISETGTERSSLITEHLAMGILSTEKKLIYGVLNTSKFGVTGYVFVAGDDSDCLEDVGCFPEDIELADAMDVGGVMTAGYREDGSVLIVKMKDDRENHQ